LVPAQAGKVTVGMASHWPCVTDSSGITTYGLMALGREMSTPPKLLIQLSKYSCLVYCTFIHSAQSYKASVYCAECDEYQLKKSVFSCLWSCCCCWAPSLKVDQ